MTRRVQLAAVLAAFLAGTGLLLAQSSVSSGGSFLPLENITVGGVWTYLGASPLTFEGATNNSLKTTVTVTDPTANRTWTIQNASDTFVGRATTDTLTNKTLTAPVVATLSNTGTLTLPTTTGGVPVVQYCGSTGSGNQTCSVATAAATTMIYAGHSTMSSNAAVITFPTAFASTTYDCVANDITTRANPVQMISTSNSTATITNTTGASDVINWVCVGQ